MVVWLPTLISPIPTDTRSKSITDAK
jgi:hypothetical protein